MNFRTIRLRMRFSSRFFFSTLALLLWGAAQPLLAATIVLDAGHGGHDPGGIPGQKFSEKNAALDVTLRVQSRLQAAGHRVVQTRSRDVFVELPRRVAVSNRTPGRPVFVSIHFNASPSRSAQGIETYYFDRRSLPLAKAIHRKVVRASGRPDRGIRRARFYVLRTNSRPASLLELGFLTHPQEGRAIAQNPVYRQKLADAVADGILSSLR